MERRTAPVKGQECDQGGKWKAWPCKIERFLAINWGFKLLPGPNCFLKAARFFALPKLTGVMDELLLQVIDFVTFVVVSLPSKCTRRWVIKIYTFTGH